MDNKITYHEQNDIDNTLKLREVLKTLPPLCRDYFRAIDATATTKTRKMCIRDRKKGLFL